MAEVTPLLPSDPESVGPYRIEGRIGAGGQGTVYLGRDEAGRRTAVKLLHAHLISHDVSRTRFLDEVEIAKRVAPFCTAQVLDSGFLEDRPYIVSEYVDGPSLLSSVRESGVRDGAALERLALNTVTALAAIHRAGVVHRDFKPGNVILGPDGPVVIDFGIARALDLTRSFTGSQPVGTPGYMAPELLRDEETGPPADMFAWGATMAYAATGRNTFGSASFAAIMHAVLHGEPYLEGLDGRLEAIVRTCLEKDPAKRPTAAEVGDLLRALPPPAWRTGGLALPEPRDDRAAETAPEADRNTETADPNTASGSRDAVLLGPGRPGVSEPVPPFKRRGVRIGAAALAALTLAGAVYTLVSSLRGPEPPRSPAASSRVTLTPSESAASADSPAAQVDAQPAPAKTARPSKEAGPRNETKSPDSPQKPTASPSAKTPRSPGRPSDRPSSSNPPPAPEPQPQQPAPLTPVTLGTLSMQDMAQYCTAHGYPLYFYYNGSLTCQGNGSATPDMTAVCRWRHPGEPNVRAEGTTCIAYR